jgi:hypothetical protein
MPSEAVFVAEAVGDTVGATGACGKVVALAVVVAVASVLGDAVEEGEVAIEGALLEGKGDATGAEVCSGLAWGDKDGVQVIGAEYTSDMDMDKGKDKSSCKLCSISSRLWRDMNVNSLLVSTSDDF